MRVADADLSIEAETYTHAVRDWLDASDHYLRNASPGGFFAVVRPMRVGLFGGVPDEMDPRPADRLSQVLPS